MRRAPLTRTTPLARRKALEQKTPIRKRNPARIAKREKECFGQHAAWIRTLPCPIDGGHPVHAHHVVSRGAGGKARDLVPLCPRCHDAIHREGAVTFCADRDIDLIELSIELWAISPARR